MAQSGVIVSRNQLYESPDSSRSSTPDEQEQELLKAAFKERIDFTIIPIETPSTDFATERQDVSPKDETVEFRLFACSSNKPARVKLDTQSDTQKPAGFVVASRPAAYYFHQTSPRLKAQLESSVITGDQLQALKELAWSGCTLPWRVVKIDQSGCQIRQNLAHSVELDSDASERQKSRPGKKVRIARRKLQAAKAAATQTAETEAKEKEAALRAKKTRRNREKKVKRKEKEKAAKLWESSLHQVDD